MWKGLIIKNYYVIWYWLYLNPRGIVMLFVTEKSIYLYWIYEVLNLPSHIIRPYCLYSDHILYWWKWFAFRSCWRKPSCWPVCFKSRKGFRGKELQQDWPSFQRVGKGGGGECRALFMGIKIENSWFTRIKTDFSWIMHISTFHFHGSWEIN